MLSSPRREQSAESVTPPGAIPDGATAGTGAMYPAFSTS